METLKRCSACHQMKEATPFFFNRNRRRPDGLHNQCKACRHAVTYPKKDKQQLRDARKRWATKLRHEVLYYYSVGQPQCACCGETHLEFLALDHIDGGGNVHRDTLNQGKKYRASGQDIYRWIRRNKFPEGFQVLCHNCNMAKSFYGRCPHRAETLSG